MSGQAQLITEPGGGQLILAGVVGICLLGAAVADYRRRFSKTASSGSSAGVWLLILAIGLNVILIAWRTAMHPDKCVPLADNFDAIILFVTLLAAVLVYLIFTTRLAAIQLAVVPVLAICQMGSIVLAGTRFKAFDADLLLTLHMGSLILSGSLFALAASGSALYLWENRQLRGLRLGPAVRTLPALESLEKLMAVSVTVGFAFLSVSVITGILETQRLEGGFTGYLSGKVLVGTVIWLAYAALLHRRYWPRLSGTRAAWLALGGFATLVALYVVLAVRQ